MHPHIVHELVRQHHADLDREASRAALAAVARSARAEYGDQQRHRSPARAAALAEAVATREIHLEDIDIRSFGQELSTQQLPELDLVIRTSGEQRISNFLL